MSRSAIFEPPEVIYKDETLGSRKLSALADDYHKLWIELLEAGVDKAIESRLFEGDETKAKLERLFLVISSHYDYVVQELLLTRQRQATQLVRQHSEVYHQILEYIEQQTEEFTRSQIPDAKIDKQDLNWRRALILSFHYFLTLSIVLSVRTFRSAGNTRGGPVPTFEAVLHEVLVELFGKLHRTFGDIRTAAAGLFQSCLSAVSKDYRAAVVPNDGFEPGAYSSLRLEELVPLARRDESLRRRYGDRNVAMVFEHQLALVERNRSAVVSVLTFPGIS